MELKEVVHDICLNSSKVGKYSFTSRLELYYSLTYVEQPEPVKQTLQQITTNLEYVYIRFDKMNCDDSLGLIRKSCIKSFDHEIVGHNNNVSAAKTIERRYKDIAKAKLLYIINKLWLFMLK